MDDWGAGSTQTTDLSKVTPEEMTGMTEANQVREVARLRFKLLTGQEGTR